MGFLDKAKQMAEQAQTKLDEVQKQFNESQGSAPQPGPGPAVEYDKHGRPVPKDDPAPPHGDPVAQSAPPPAPAAPAAPPTAPAEGAEEDRNHPSYAPPNLTSGDPLAG
jgi:hypothetical protein